MATAPVNGFNETLAAAVNSAAVRHCGDSGTFVDVSDGNAEYTCNVYLDRLSGPITGDYGPDEARPMGQIPDDQIPEPGHGDRVQLLGVSYVVDAVAHNNGLWVMDLRKVVQP